MSDWSVEKKVDIICKHWEIQRLKELEEQREREAKLAENKKDITEPAKPDAPVAKAEAKEESSVRKFLHKLHINF